MWRRRHEAPGDQPEEGPRGDQPEEGPRGDQPEEGPRGDQPEEGPRGDQPEEGPRGDQPEEGPRAPDGHVGDESGDPTGTDLLHGPRRPAGGALGSIMAGLADALYGPRKNEPVVVEKAPGAPPGHSLEVLLDREHPEHSRVIIHGDAPSGGPER